MDPYEKNRKFLLLSTSLLVDRVFLHTNLIPRLSELGRVEVWAASDHDKDYSELWKRVKAKVLSFPAVLPFKEFPYNYLRRFNEFVWDYRLKSPSRMSIKSHVRDKNQEAKIKALRIPARVFSYLNSEKWLEDYIEKIMLNYPPRCSAAIERMKIDRPSVVVSTGLFQFEQPAVYEAAKKLGIPVIAYVPSWDNITTKNRMIFKYDAFIVWSEQTKKELHEFYPATRDVPVYVIGAPQFDVFLQDKFLQTREEYCKSQDLDPSRPIVVYALGSPNFLQEHHGAIHMAKEVFEGEFGDIQLLVRPHPIHDNGELRNHLKPYAPMVKLQETPNVGRNLTARSQDEVQIVEWVNTFKHADVVVNLSSTVTIDAAIFDTPVVNLDFDPQPSREDQELIKDINHKWDHFAPIAESGGVWLVNDFEELTNAVHKYLENPELHSKERREIVEYVCGYVDGKCGDRMAEAIADAVETFENKARISSNGKKK